MPLRRYFGKVRVWLRTRLFPLVVYAILFGYMNDFTCCT